jgi:hypothetical protein
MSELCSYTRDRTQFPDPIHKIIMLYQIINTNFNNAYGSPSEIQIIYSLHFNGTDLYRTQDQLTVDDRVIYLKNNKKERKKLRTEINKKKH